MEAGPTKATIGSLDNLIAPRVQVLVCDSWHRVSLVNIKRMFVFYYRNNLIFAQDVLSDIR
jgi:hypothetical protein